MIMKEAEIWGIAETEDGYMVFIRPLASNYSVPIFIGQLEAQAILIGFGGISVPRPLTVDLILTVIEKANFEVSRIEISELKDNTFYARLILVKKEEVPAKKKREAVAEADSTREFILDARPSDALALAVRCKCSVFIADSVVKEAGILAEEPTASVWKDTDTEKTILKNELEEAITAENYERAAEIRDMLNLLDQTEKNT
jgi:bifunctional DNase/RNase